MTRTDSTAKPGFAYPIPRVFLIAAFLLSAMGAIPTTLDLVDAPLADWAIVSSQFREGLTLAGPLAGLVAFWLALRTTGERSLVLPATGARSGHAVAARHIFSIGVVSATGYALGLGATIWDAASQARAGAPDLLVISTFLPVMFFFVGIGWLTGVVLAGRSVVAVLGLAFLLGVVGLGAAASFQALPLTPTWGGTTASAGWVENAAVSVFRWAYFSAWVWVATLAAGLWLSHRHLSWGSRSKLSSMPLLAIVPLVVLVLLRPVDPIVPEAGPPTECESVGEVKVCVHEAHADLLPRFKATTAAALGAVNAEDGSLVSEVSDSSLYPRRPDARILRVPLQWEHGSDWPDRVEIDVAYGLAGAQQCGTVEQAREKRDIVRGIGGWIYERAGFGEPDWVGPVRDIEPPPERLRIYQRMQELDISESVAWLKSHASEVVSCDLSTQEIP